MTIGVPAEMKVLKSFWGSGSGSGARIDCFRFPKVHCAESGPLAELLVYLLVTLRPCTRLPGVYTLFIQKIWLA